MSRSSDLIQRADDIASERVWNALSDSTRRAMLDALTGDPLLTSDLVARFAPMYRTNVMKHLDVLTEANLVIIRRQGRQRWNCLNPLPIQRICDRRVSRHMRGLASAMTRLKQHVETNPLSAAKE